MGKKIFVSYKYADRLVRKLYGSTFWSPTTVRDYVDILQSKIDHSDHIYKGEDDGEDLSSLADSTISSKLGDKIFDSSITIVFISKGMKESQIPEKDQWIPWEISYSLKEQSRQYGHSKTNAMLAVILPDENNSYQYLIEYDDVCKSTTYKTDTLFDILRDNMFNIKEPETRFCNGKIIYSGNCSYIHLVRWDDFINEIDHYIAISLSIWKDRDKYKIRKVI